MIRPIIQQLAKTDDELYSKVCKVTSVDKSANLCDVEPLDDSAELVNVRLQAGDGNGLVVYPVVGSVVVVSFLDKNNGFVALVSEVDVFDIQTQNESLKAILSDLLSAIKTLTVTTPSGPSGTPINFAQFDALTNRLNNLLK